MKSQLDLTLFVLGLLAVGGNFMTWLQKCTKESMITLGERKCVTPWRVKFDAQRFQRIKEKGSVPLGSL